MYKALADGVTGGDSEVGLVGRMAESATGMEYNGVRLFARKIHGTTSWVTFPYRGRPTTKELGDTCFITVVTKNHRRIFERICFVQNKLATKEAWDVDAEQLYLLRNFPPLSGTQGLLAGHTDSVFRNHSGCLGAFGLLSNPGEMMFCAAPLFSEFVAERTRVRRKDIALSIHEEVETGTPWALDHPWMCELVEQLWERRLWLNSWGCDVRRWPLLGVARFARDLLSLARSITLCNVGELCVAAGETLDAPLDNLAVSLMRAADLGDTVDLGNGGTGRPEGITVFVLQTEIAERQ